MYQMFEEDTCKRAENASESHSTRVKESKASHRLPGFGITTSTWVLMTGRSSIRQPMGCPHAVLPPGDHLRKRRGHAEESTGVLLAV